MKKDLNEKSSPLSRRQFLGRTTTAVTTFAMASLPAIGAPAFIRNLGKPNSKINGVQIGAITYSFRSLPTDAESILKYCVDSGISAIELMGPTAEAFAGAPHTSTEPMVRGRRPKISAEERASMARETAEWRAKASMDKFEQLRKMYKDRGVSIYAWKPSALGEHNTDAEIEYALRAARALGATHVTVELPKNPEQTKRLGQFADKHKIAVAYHGHLQQTPTIWDVALSQAKYNAMNLDAGHYVAAGFDPIDLIKSKHDHIYSMHLKDRQSKANGQKNLPWGQGDTPIPAILQLMRKNKYKFPGTIELEYEIPDGSDAVKEVAKCLDFCRKALA